MAMPSNTAGSAPPSAVGSSKSAVLKAASCCYKQLSWEYEIADRVNARELARELPNHGFVDESRLDAVREFRASEGHAIVLIPKTGRLQIRVHYLTPLSDRKAVAQKVAALLEQLLSGLEPSVASVVS